MPQVSCTRCFAVFASEELRPGAIPLCPGCTPAQAAVPGAVAPAAASGPVPGRRLALPRVGRWVAGAAAVAAAAAAALVVLRSCRPGPAPVAAAATPSGAALEAIAAWRAAGLLPPDARPGPPGSAQERLSAGRAALESDRPGAARQAAGAFREALAREPEQPQAVAGYAVALADGGLDTLEGEEIARAHALVREALARGGGSGDDPRLLAAYARLLLAVPGARNLAEAGEVVARARAKGGADPDVALAAGLSELHRDPAAGARLLAAAARAAPSDRRLLSAAARAAWEAGDAAGARALAAARLELDADHPGALALSAELAVSAERPEEARVALQRWARADPAAAEPLLLEARLQHQLESDLPAARKLLAAAMERGPDEFLAARVLAHRAAVEEDAGDLTAARAAVAEALRRVPASGPAQLQAAMLAWAARDARALRLAAGTVGERAGEETRTQLAARLAELSGEPGEVIRAYQAAAAAGGRDPRALLWAAGGLARVRAPTAALEVARQALRRDLADARLPRLPTDYWEGPGQVAEAARALQELARGRGEGSGAALAAAAACELLLGHTRDADRLARASQEAEPEAGAPRVLRAQLALDLAQPARALSLAFAASEASDRDPAAQAVLGRALEASGRLPEAERAYGKALAADPGLLAVRLALARLALKRGNAAAGRALLEGLRRDAPQVIAVRRALLELPSPAP